MDCGPAGSLLRLQHLASIWLVRPAVPGESSSPLRFHSAPPAGPAGGNAERNTKSIISEALCVPLSNSPSISNAVWTVFVPAFILIQAEKQSQSCWKAAKLCWGRADSLLPLSPHKLCFILSLSAITFLNYLSVPGWIFFLKSSVLLSMSTFQIIYHRPMQFIMTSLLLLSSNCDLIEIKMYAQAYSNVVVSLGQVIEGVSVVRHIWTKDSTFLFPHSFSNYSGNRKPDCILFEAMQPIKFIFFKQMFYPPVNLD